MAQIFSDDVEVERSESQYRYEEVEGLPGVPSFLMEYLQNFDNVLADLERAEATISVEKSDMYWNRVKIDQFVCEEAGRWPQASKVDKVWNQHCCENCTRCRGFLGLCT